MKTYVDDIEIQRHPTRHGWYCKPSPGGGFVGWEGGHAPWIKANHIDGPLLTFSDGQMHWLSPLERILFALGLTDAEKIQRKRRPYLSRFINTEHDCSKQSGYVPR